MSRMKTRDRIHAELAEAETVVISMTCRGDKSYGGLFFGEAYKMVRDGEVRLVRETRETRYSNRGKPIYVRQIEIAKPLKRTFVVVGAAALALAA